MRGVTGKVEAGASKRNRAAESAMLMIEKRYGPLAGTRTLGLFLVEFGEFGKEPCLPYPALTRPGGDLHAPFASREPRQLSKGLLCADAGSF
ncbi:hypothetical protein S40285_09819 [Stachybotrys chlorohalonatus IBT 40285]|uniref:Uncharacterized protein n=1 Tax=Stachybotrys chlorohalonatus (strain IBT 40285) TaxID=1283841 RepID=A0A084QZ55_STAC4|nr:hypothetical protein S40285_09819 [Stachybotrys chlorohalonata IBT 40285]